MISPVEGFEGGQDAPPAEVQLTEEKFVLAEMVTGFDVQVCADDRNPLASSAANRESLYIIETFTVGLAQRVYQIYKKKQKAAIPLFNHKKPTVIKRNNIVVMRLSATFNMYGMTFRQIIRISPRHFSEKSKRFPDQHERNPDCKV